MTDYPIPLPMVMNNRSGQTEVTLAPDRTVFTWPAMFHMLPPCSFDNDKGILTIKAPERTLVYEIEPETDAQRFRSVRYFRKVYDDSAPDRSTQGSTPRMSGWIGDLNVAVAAYALSQEWSLRKGTHAPVGSVEIEWDDEPGAYYSTMTGGEDAGTLAKIRTGCICGQTHALTHRFNAYDMAQFMRKISADPPQASPGGPS